jgi:hypothetical protein
MEATTMTVDDKLDKIWDEIKEHRKETQTLAISVAAHCSQNDIHQRPPCESVQTLSNRVWAAVTTALVALAGAVYTLIVDRLPH